MFIANEFDPLREPDWRSDRARYLVDSGQRVKQPTQFDDDHVRAYRRFLMEWRKGQANTRQRLIAESPGLYYAFKISTHPDREWKAILDAKILAREPDDLIAAELDTLPDTIHWYEALFFNVRDRLHAKTYIIKTILGPPTRRTLDYDDVLTEDLRYLCYKCFAYFGGPMILDMLLVAYSDMGTWPRRPDEQIPWLDQAFKLSLRTKSTMTAQTFTVNKFNCMELMQMHVALIGQLETAKAAGAGGPASEYTRNLETFFEQMPIAIGKKAEAIRSPQLLEYENTAVEPRAIESIQLAQGTIPEGLAEKLETAPGFDIRDDNDG